MNKVLAHPLVLTIVTVLFLVFWWSLYRTMSSFNSSRERLAALRSEVNDQAEQVQELEVELQIARDEFTKEKIARNELLQQKPAEYVVKIDVAPERRSSRSKTTPKTPWEEWRELLLNQ